MKVKASSLVLGVCLAIMAVVAAPAFARSNTAFSAYHVENPLGSDPYTCVTEDNGAVFNNCTYTVSLEFDLPIDNAGEKTVTVRDFWQGTAAQNTFNCYLYAYTGTSGTSIEGTPAIAFNGISQTASTTVNVASGSNMQLICWNIPPQGGVANLSWNQ
jgi:hypothetical protein